MPRFERETREEVIPSFPSPSISRLVQGKVFEVFGNANCFLKIYLQTRNVPLSISAAQYLIIPLRAWARKGGWNTG